MCRCPRNLQNLHTAEISVHTVFEDPCNGPFHTTLEGIQLRVNKIASFAGVYCNTIFGIKCVNGILLRF